MGEWEKAQEGEKDKGKGGSKRKVVRREDAEEEEVVTRVNKEDEELEEFGAEIFEASEKFEYIVSVTFVTLIITPTFCATIEAHSLRGRPIPFRGRWPSGMATE